MVDHVRVLVRHRLSVDVVLAGGKLRHAPLLAADAKTYADADIVVPAAAVHAGLVLCAFQRSHPRTHAARLSAPVVVRLLLLEQGVGEAA